MPWSITNRPLRELGSRCFVALDDNALLARPEYLRDFQNFSMYLSETKPLRSPVKRALERIGHHFSGTVVIICGEASQERAKEDSVNALALLPNRKMVIFLSALPAPNAFCLAHGDNRIECFPLPLLLQVNENTQDGQDGLGNTPRCHGLGNRVGF